MRLTATIVRIFRFRPSPWGSGAMSVHHGTRIKTQYFGPNSRFTWYYQYQLKWGSIDWFWCEHFFGFDTSPQLQRFSMDLDHSKRRVNSNSTQTTSDLVGWFDCYQYEGECYLRLLHTKDCYHTVNTWLFWFCLEDSLSLCGHAERKLSPEDRPVPAGYSSILKQYCFNNIFYNFASFMKIAFKY